MYPLLRFAVRAVGISNPMRLASDNSSVKAWDRNWRDAMTLLVLCSDLLAASAEAGQEWELISVTRGPTWEVNKAKGALKQNGQVLEGVRSEEGGVGRGGR